MQVTSASTDSTSALLSVISDPETFKTRVKELNDATEKMNKSVAESRAVLKQIEMEKASTAANHESLREERRTFETRVKEYEELAKGQLELYVKEKAAEAESILAAAGDKLKLASIKLDEATKIGNDASDRLSKVEKREEQLAKDEANYAKRSKALAKDEDWYAKAIERLREIVK